MLKDLVLYPHLVDFQVLVEVARQASEALVASVAAAVPLTTMKSS